MDWSNYYTYYEILHYTFTNPLYLHSIDMSIFNAKYLTMNKVQMHAGVISKLVYGFVSVRAIINSLKLVDYLIIQTHKPYNNF